MSARLHRHVLWSLALLFIAAGCGSDKKSTEPAKPAPDVKPIDQVQTDIVAVKQQLLGALSAAESHAGNLQATVAATELAINELRNTLAQLDQRADEYLAMWSRQATVAITADGVYRTPNEQPKRSKAKYDQMLAALRAARDQINPAIAELRQVAKADPSTNTSQLVASAHAQGMRGIDRLDEALKHLADLKSLIRQP